MPQYIAIEWNVHRAHALQATTRGKELVLERAVTIEGDEGNVPDRLAATLRRWRVGKAQVVILVERAACELRLLNMPPLPGDELPDAVRFQALQQFSSFGEDWPLDYVPRVAADGSLRVLTATLPPHSLSDVQAPCRSLGLAVVGAVLRPCGAASFVARAAVQMPGTCRLIVELIEDRAEIIVADRADVMMCRSVQLPDDQEAEARHEALRAEVRRTLAALSSQFPDRTVEGIAICGDGPLPQSICEALDGHFGVPIVCLPTLEACPLSDELREQLPVHLENFAPLLGALWDEAAQARRAIDFLRPRHAPEPTDRRTLWTTAALIAAGLALLCGATLWWSLSRQDAELAQLRTDIREMDKLVEVAKRQELELAQIDQWYAYSPNWLTELRALAERLPPVEQLKVQSLQADLANEGGGRITLKGFVDSSATISELEIRLRDRRHSVVGMDRDYSGDDPSYPWYFMEQVQIAAEPATAADDAPPNLDNGLEEAQP